MLAVVPNRRRWLVRHPLDCRDRRAHAAIRFEPCCVVSELLRLLRLVPPLLPSRRASSAARVLASPPAFVRIRQATSGSPVTAVARQRPTYQPPNESPPQMASHMVAHDDDDRRIRRRVTPATDTRRRSSPLIDHARRHRLRRRPYRRHRRALHGPSPGARSRRSRTRRSTRGHGSTPRADRDGARLARPLTDVAATLAIAFTRNRHSRHSVSTRPSPHLAVAARAGAAQSCGHRFGADCPELPAGPCC